MGITSILVTSLPIVQDATAKVDRFIGEWINWDCGEVMCSLDITKRGESYAVTFSAYEFGKAEEPLCRSTITMKRGPLEFTASNHAPDALSGAFGDEPLVYIEPLNQTEISFVTVARCAHHTMGGLYVREGH